MKLIANFLINKYKIFVVKL